MWSGCKTSFNDSNLSVCKLPTSTVRIMSGPLNCDFVPILMFRLFDCLAEGINYIVVFGHIPGHPSMVKCGGSHFQIYANAAIFPRFLVRVGFNSHSGYNISNALPSLTESAYKSKLFSEAAQNISQSS